MNRNLFFSWAECVIGCGKLQTNILVNKFKYLPRKKCKHIWKKMHLMKLKQIMVLNGFAYIFAFSSCNFFFGKWIPGWIGINVGQQQILCISSHCAEGQVKILQGELSAIYPFENQFQPTFIVIRWHRQLWWAKICI